MALGTALVDRARVVSTKSTGVKVEGRSHTTTVTSPWFKARLSSAEAGESPEIANGVVRPITRTTLMFGMKDMTGQPVEVHNVDHIEVTQPGTAFTPTRTFQATGDPKPIRKKRRQIGWTVPVTRVYVNEMEAV